MQKYKFLPHTADVKFQAFGKNLEEAFSNSALALKEIISKNKVKVVINKKIKVKGKDKESLLLNFLEEFLFLFETKGFLLSEIKKISITNKIDKLSKSRAKLNKKIYDYELKCEVLGDDAKEYELGNHVKAITYNEMFVKKEKNKKGKYKYTCQVVVDV